MQKNPTFKVFVGPMFSSKTNRLLMEIDHCKRQKKDVLAFKPKIDDRYDVNAIVSHAGLNTPAIIVETGADVLKHISDVEKTPGVVAVDEAFMIKGISDALIWLYRNAGLSIVVSTLDISSNGKPFNEIKELLMWATHVEKCVAACCICGEDAHYTHKKHSSDDEICVGGNEMYEPRCGLHHESILDRDLVLKFS